MFSIDQYAYSNRLKNVHPGEKIAFALVTLLIALVAPRPSIPAIIIALMAGATIGFAGIPARFYLQLMLVPFSFLLAGVIMIALTITGQPQTGLKGVTILGWTFGVTPAGMHLAGKIFLKSLGAAACLYFLSLTTPMVDILTVLRQLRFPALLVDLISLTYRFIFVLLATVNDIYTAQASRLGYTSLRTSYHSLGQLAASLFIKTYRRSQELFTALTARGYHEELRVLEAAYPFSWPFLCLAAIFDLALVILMLLT
ncbi:MAG: cobalt/nickel transport system permease protein [Moorella sp. (in: firmicutes)]|jgi:cobalt/nickel transport system permease protein|uniref:cobalt ECF transporter T component CbiQ n=1 Tax=unclassified Neomoorella TaxID=2676739 RepID=UPI0010FFC240|nr:MULTISPECIES: cobalt ECF transporter T component CbiQ [unclassified Moorella (in: firmicutes)]MDK2816741.1 cobalt/nickel transport system permease protein [Moorella sp. (in: firmicutes)]MDK2894757.1 cobalt/nickel transport system permease protein [Moorella sp. (in: firmicutes)]GEA15631.1 cobalt ECF transporter T component CbiQ [Moorella sp. E308F]GEA19511.1 cobalt ECF transporter T component CbiQ [Moorella sp. E306M]